MAKLTTTQAWHLSSLIIAVTQVVVLFCSSHPCTPSFSIIYHFLLDPLHIKGQIFVCQQFHWNLTSLPHLCSFTQHFAFKDHWDSHFFLKLIAARKITYKTEILSLPMLLTYSSPFFQQETAGVVLRDPGVSVAKLFFVVTSRETDRVQVQEWYPTLVFFTWVIIRVLKTSQTNQGILTEGQGSVQWTSLY